MAPVARLGRETRSESSIWSPAFAALLVMSFFMAMGQTTASTVLPLYAHALGVGTSMVGFVTGSFAITALAVRPFVGPAFDSFSKKRMLAASMAVIFLAMLIYAASDSLPVILAARLLHGLGMGCLGPLAMALVCETLPPDRLSSGMSVYTVAQAAAQAVGPAFGIWLSGAVGFSATFYATAASMAAAFLLVMLAVRERSDVERPPYRLTLRRAFAREVVLPTIVIALLDASYKCTSAFMAIYGGLRGVEGVGLYFTVYAVCLLGTRPLFGKLADRLGAQRVLVPAMALFALSYVLVSRAATLVGFVAAAVVAACGFGVSTPLVQALAFSCVPPERRGSASNTVYLGLDVGTLAGPVVGGMVAEALEASGMAPVQAYSGMWLVMLVPIALGLALFLLARPRIERYQRRVAEAACGAAATSHQAAEAQE